MPKAWMLLFAVIGCAQQAAMPERRPTRLALTPMPTPRAGAAVAVGRDGTIYLIGGWDDKESYGIVESYHPDSDSWSVLPPLKQTRYQAQAATLADGRIAVFGGITGTKDKRRRLASVEVFSPADQTWSSLADMTVARGAHASAVGSNGRLYAIGGNADDGEDIGYAGLVEAASRSVDVYDPATRRWALMAPLPMARWTATAAAGSDGKIYVMGGLTRGGSLSSVDVYDPKRNLWSPGAPMAASRAEHSSAVGRDRHIYVIGGAEMLPNWQPLSRTEAYSPADGRWQPVANPPDRVYAVAAAGADGEIYLFGGLNARFQYIGEVQRYSPRTNSWLQSK